MLCEHPRLLMQGTRDELKQIDLMQIYPDLITKYTQPHTLSQLEHTRPMMTFADILDTHIRFKVLRESGKYQNVDDFITDEVYEMCCPVMLYDIMKPRWTKEKGSFFVHTGNHHIHLKVRDSRAEQVKNFMHMNGYELISQHSGNSVNVSQWYAFDHIPTDVRNYKLVEQPSLNGTIYVGPKHEKHTIRFRDETELKQYDWLSEYDIDGRPCISRCVYYYPDETVIYAGVID